ncbi:hypothetical protein [Flagellimonas sp.]|uniref:ORC-CDC6 family AAA ATPase n=1 Tax=Flagellimonas sp. TaxID=2058762 RepID=UPI003BADA8BD
MSDSKPTTTIKSLSQNRAEEFGFDVYDDFVIPPIFKQLDLYTSSKPKVFIGGRGCGKTMLLRYLSHGTAFSQSKKEIHHSDLRMIGLYWKFDTNVTHLIQKRGIEVDRWHAAFEHLATIKLSMELVNSLKSIALSNYEGFKESDLKELAINDCLAFEKDLPGNLMALAEELKRKLAQFQVWLRNVRKGPEPIFFPKDFLDALVKELIAKVPCFNDSVFFVYLDEYENLLEYQQKIVNTWVKHSERPLVYHLAMKRNAFRTKNTIGEETLSDVHDFRYHDLEEELEDSRNFMVFAGEIVLYRLFQQGNKELDIDPDLLKNANRIMERWQREYQDKILIAVNKMFPSMNNNDLANRVLKDGALFNRMIEKLGRGLSARGSDLDAERFVYKEDLRVSIVCTSLIHRQNLKVEYILEQIQCIKEKRDNDFFGSREWISNNFIGSYLLLYFGTNKACPFYSGYRAFCTMSNGNIRHLMELCHKTFLRASEDNTSENIRHIWNIDYTHQAQAARQASTTFLNEIRTFGRYGNQLHTFVLRLGLIFQAAHRRLVQSEPEQNHFSIKGGSTELSKDHVEFLLEATKWSVLFEEESTKTKSENDPDLPQYVLNPIYAPYFHISYRKMRKIEFSTSDFIILTSGNLDQYENLFKRYKRKWGLEIGDDGPDLFSNLSI